MPAECAGEGRIELQRYKHLRLNTGLSSEVGFMPTAEQL